MLSFAYSVNCKPFEFQELPLVADVSPCMRHGKDEGIPSVQCAEFPGTF